MLDRNDLIAEFDEDKRILHLTGHNQIRITTSEEIKKAFGVAEELLIKYTSEERCYLIIDLGKIIISPNLISEYVELSRPFLEKYLYPKGVARYGYQVTRLTVRLSHEKFPEIEPNMFASKVEASEYIHTLIEKNKASANVRT